MMSEHSKDVIDRVRAIRRKISGEVGNDPEGLVRHYEVSKRDDRIHALAAIRTDRDQSLVFDDLHAGTLAGALTHLDDFADGANFLLGHNLIDFDLPHLRAANRDLRLLRLPAVDTLRLNPLAFPRNPYHYLVKHYQDGQLKRGRLNDPEQDARLVLEKVFARQQTELRDAPLGLLAAWHWLTGTGPDSEGFDAVFASIRYGPRPTDAVAKAAIHERLAGIACQNHGWDVLENVAQSGWPLAYALAWLSVSGGNSVMPPWVQHRFQKPVSWFADYGICPAARRIAAGAGKARRSQGA